MSKKNIDTNVILESLGLYQKNYTSDSICRDYFGNKISIGDYVIAHEGIPLSESREGYVVDIIEYEYGSFIKISTPGGRIVAHSDHPHDYIIKSQN